MSEGVEPKFLLIPAGRPPFSRFFMGPVLHQARLLLYPLEGLG